jgi:serine/threonine protein kinase
MLYEKTEELIGKGGYSSVYICKKKGKDSNQAYAMKISLEQQNNSSKNHLLIEYKILKRLIGGIGIPKVYYYGKENDNIFLVQELLGNNLSQEMKKRKNKFSKKTFISIALQMISRIEFLHSYGFIHCDIKPDNFVLNLEKEKENENVNENKNAKDNLVIYLIDYGLAEPYINLKTKEHKKLKEQQGPKGTFDFCSINNHMGISLSRRDDIESLAYCLIYFYLGKLPWSSRNSSIKSRENIMNAKIEFCSFGKNIKNLHKNLCKILDYATRLQFEEKPNYKYLKDLVKEME